MYKQPQNDYKIINTKTKNSFGDYTLEIAKCMYQLLTKRYGNHYNILRIKNRVQTTLETF